MNSIPESGDCERLTEYQSVMHSKCTSFTNVDFFPGGFFLIRVIKQINVWHTCCPDDINCITNESWNNLSFGISMHEVFQGYSENYDKVRLIFSFSQTDQLKRWWSCSNCVYYQPLCLKIKERPALETRKLRMLVIYSIHLLFSSRDGADSNTVLSSYTNSNKCLASVSFDVKDGDSQNRCNRKI